MGSQCHSYRVSVSWTGNRGPGTSGYRAYDRSHQVTAGRPDAAEDPPGPGRPQPITGSSDPAFRGDPACWNPEQLHRDAHEMCFIARSVNFPVRHQPVVVAGS